MPTMDEKIREFLRAQERGGNPSTPEYIMRRQREDDARTEADRLKAQAQIDALRRKR